MKTAVLMERELFGMPIRQNSQTEFLCANDLVKAGNKFRALNGMSLFDFRSWMDSQHNKEFIKEMENQYGDVISTTKGKKGSTWLHPYIFIDLALAIDPKLKIEVYSWMFDHLIKVRNDSGNSYKKMCGALFANCNNKSNFYRGVQTTAGLIQNACKVKDWQTATENQLKLRDKIHENIYLLTNVLRDNNQAIRLGIQEALKNI
jgi:hypothetical protein